MRLFAEKGFSATSVGDIESAVGLQPRRGALYKHFPSKEALLQEAVRHRLDEVAVGAAQLQALDLAITSAEPELLRPIAVALGQWLLAELDRLRDLTQVIEHEGRRLRKLRNQVRREVVDTGNAAAAQLLRAAVPGHRDPEATAVIFIGALTGVRRAEWTYGAPPLGVDDDRAVAAWADLLLSLVSGP
jgi:AcrR family transcriptional regulator